MSKQMPLRIFSTDLTGNREFYASRRYKASDDGNSVLALDKPENVTDEIRPLLVKAQRDMAVVIKTWLEQGGHDSDAVMRYLDEQIELRTEREATNG